MDKNIGENNEEKLEKNNEEVKGENTKSNDLEFKTVDYSEYNQDVKRKGKGVKIFIITMLVLLLIGLATIFLLNGYDIVNYIFDRANISSNNEKNEENNIDNNESNNVEDNNENKLSVVEMNKLYQRVHCMANNLIKAEDGKIRGREEITKNNVNEAIKDLEGNDDYLKDELLKWLDLDFSNAVEVHNYVWKKLDGNEGKANGVNEDGVAQAIKTLGE